MGCLRLACGIRGMIMKKYFAILSVFAILLSCPLLVLATDGNVTYSGDAGKFIFAPGSEYSLTDLFSNFKDVMPGDSISQPIIVKNNASQKVKIKVYMRALGAHENSVEFLSKLHLRVEKSEDNTMGYMFDAATNETSQLTDWVCLGTLYSGGEVKLNVILDVPVELNNDFQNAIGYLDWEFMIEEYEIEPNDPEPPQSGGDSRPTNSETAKTGDDSQVFLWVSLMTGSLVMIILPVFIARKNE